MTRKNYVPAGPTRSAPANVVTRHLDRRSFFKVGAAGAASLLLPNIITSSALGAGGRASAGNRIIVGVIGVGVMGRNNLGGFLNNAGVQVVAACDVIHEKRERAKEQVDAKYNNKDCATYVDYRELIARDDIDVVMCATTDHWHAQVSIDAMKAGKDVYCEKPVSLTIGEGRKMVEAARRYGRVITGGSQRVIGDYGTLACAARSGRFGRMLYAEVDPGGPSQTCYLPEEPMPPGIMDYDLWLGPAPWAPYHSRRVSSTPGADANGGLGWRFWYDYCGGGTTDWGSHFFGGILHAMGLDHTGPTEILPEDKKKGVPMTLVFENGMELRIKGGRDMKYFGEAGRILPAANEPVPPGLRWYEDGAKHPMTDLLNCVRTRKRPFQDIEYAHRTATICHLVNIGRRLGRPLKWDPVKEDFINDPEASRHINRPRRGPWQI